MTQPDTLRPRSCPTCRSIGTPRDGCQNLWHIEVRRPVVSAPLISAEEAASPQPVAGSLHTRLVAAIQARLDVARAAEADGGWESLARWLPPLAGYLRLHDPADAIRRYEGELEVLERHAPGYPGGEVDYGTHTERTESGQYVEVRDAEPVPAYYCERCDDFQPCPEIRSLAHRLGVSIDA